MAGGGLGEEENEEEQVEEAKVARPAKDPKAPTKAEKDAHEATHLPFRSWCAECVAGRRDNPPHYKRPEEEHQVPEVMMDYAFVRRKDETEMTTILILKDRESRAVRVWTMRFKGVCTDEAAMRAAEGIRALGHSGKIIIKVDNMPALKALRVEVIKKLEHGAIPSAPPVKESESNGAVENGVKLFKGVLRVHLMALERKIEGYIPSSHPIMAWLVEHVADVLTKYLQGSDGKTGYQRLFGKQVHEEGLEFGEKVMYRLKRTNEMNVVLDARWEPGVWLGRTWGTISNRIAKSDKEVVEVRAVHRVPQVERWSRDDLNNLKATPWQWTATEESGAAAVIAPRSEEEKAQDEPKVENPDYNPKRVYLRKEDMEKWGYTAGCRRCQLVRETRSAGGVPHTSACRTRLETCLKAAEDPRLQQAEERISSEVVRRTEEEPHVGGGEEECQGEDGPIAGPVADAQPEPLEEDKDEDTIGLLTRGMPVEIARDFVNIYELFLINGVSASDARAKVCELYSPPRVTAEMQNVPILGLAAGTTFDLRMDENGNSWHLLLERDRRRARQKIEIEKPYMVIGSPPCTYYSILTKLNFSRMNPEVLRRRLMEAQVLLNFAMEIYEMQLRGGRHFLHEFLRAHQVGVNQRSRSY